MPTTDEGPEYTNESLPLSTAWTWKDIALNEKSRHRERSTVSSYAEAKRSNSEREKAE